jgi:inner membrane protein
LNFSPVLIWSIIGVVLIIIEVSSFTFVLCFFGIGALLVAFTTLIHLTTEIYSQVISFSIISVGLMILMRKTLKRLFPGTKDKAPDYLGKRAKVTKTVSPSEEGTISYRGSEWIAFCDGSETFQQGEIVEIIDMDGIRMKIKRPKNSN